MTDTTSCGRVVCYEYASRPIFKCKACGHQFSVTSGTIFASRKLPMWDYLVAIAIFVNGAKGALAQLSRDLDVQYKTAFVLAHKLREAMAAEQRDKQLGGEIEIDGAYFGGHVRPENRKEDRKDRRLIRHQTGKRRFVVALRERQGRTLPFVVITEDQAVPMVRATVKAGSTIFADEASSWDVLHAFYDARRINHSIAFHTKAWTPIRPSRSSPGSGAPRSASTIASAAICTPTLPRWRRARITGASPTERST